VDASRPQKRAAAKHKFARAGRHAQMAAQAMTLRRLSHTFNAYAPCESNMDVTLATFIRVRLGSLAAGRPRLLLGIDEGQVISASACWIANAARAERSSSFSCGIGQLISQFECLRSLIEILVLFTHLLMGLSSPTGY
jgi:hypothetical protein